MRATTFVFPHATLTKIEGKPTHETVTIFKSELYANALQNDCTLGGGDNGYLGLIMPTTEYEKTQTDDGVQHPIAFAKPPPPDPTAAEAIIIRTNKEILDYKTMEGQLKGQIIAAIHMDYIAEIRDTKFGFAKVTTKALLAFIVTKYDVITPNELTQNWALLEEAWDITKPIMGLWSRIRAVQNLAQR